MVAVSLKKSFFQAEDGIRDVIESRGLGDVYKRQGTIYIDNGAAKALSNGKSLLAAGIFKINGNFKKGENVVILDQNNNQLARGLSSFSSTEIEKIKGKQSKEIEKILGYLSKTEVIHKDDMVLL